MRQRYARKLGLTLEEYERRMEEKRARGAARKEPAPPRVYLRTCVECDMPFATRRKTALRCSQPCRNRQISRHIVNRYHTEPEYKDRVLARAHRDRARKLGIDAPMLSLLSTAERDNWTCGICGEPVDQADMSLDHITPLEHGGDHSYDNVQLSHLTCNVRKAADTKIFRQQEAS